MEKMPQFGFMEKASQEERENEEIVENDFEDFWDMYYEDLIDKSYPVEDPRRWLKVVEHESENTISQYFDNLGLSKEMIAGKKRILDIGASSRSFALYCAKEKLNKNIVSLDSRHPEWDEEGIVEATKIYWTEQVYDLVTKNTVIADMEAIPFKDEAFDFIISHCAMPGISNNQNKEFFGCEGVKSSIDEIVRVLEPGGEARLFPLNSVSEDEFYEKRRKTIEAELERVSLEAKCLIFYEDVVRGEGEERRIDKRVIIKKKI